MSVSRESLLKVLRDRVLARVQRGPLLDISIGKSARRFDLLDLGNDDPQRAYDALNYVVSRSQGKLTLPILEDEEAGFSKEDADANIAVLRKIERIKRTVSLYERETGVNPLYLAFPLIMVREADAGGKARCILAPLFVWPLTLNKTRTQQGQVEIGFDKERGLIHENPALQPWLKERLNVEVNLEETAGKLTALDRITWEDVLTAATECLKGFQRVSLLRESAPLLAVRKKDDQIPANQLRIYSSAAVSIIDWIHQSVVADLAKLSQEAGESQLLDLFLGLRSGDREDGPNETVPEEDRFFIADADPAQQKAVLGARKSKGLVIHGPPGTGKSQTIVNVVIDSVAKGQKVLVVCQKQAAINVVAKRLTKEGISNLAVFVHDAMKDRVRVIEDLKKQIDNWAESRNATIDENRRSVCRKIVEIERELRSYTEALWTSKSKSGLSYRQILARLARQRVDNPSIRELRDLRPLLAILSEPQVGDLAEQIAEIAPLWQNADLADNPWRRVKPFLFNDQSATEIREALSAAAEVLRVREDHLEKFPDVLPDLDDVALEMWLREADDELKKLSDETWRTRVGSWMSLVDSLGEQASTKILGDLAATRGDFEVLQTAHKDICWVNHFQEIDDSKLYSIQQNCELFLKHYKGWFRWPAARTREHE
jgi:primosomal replication protein N''